VAIVPGGTGNVLAGALRIRGVPAALEVIRSGHTRRLDLGRARWGGVDGDEHERTFTVASGTGFDARMIAAAEGPWKRHLGFGAYIGAALREVARTRPARFRIVADDATLELEGLVVLVVNIGELIPGRLGPRRAISPDDGRLELLVVGGRNLVAGLRGAVELLLRPNELDGTVIRRSVRRVRVESDPPQLVETDGDAHPPGWLEASVLPGALTVLAPGP
jgi:diacylglycerol kinase family enzyme